MKTKKYFLLFLIPCLFFSACNWFEELVGPETQKTPEYYAELGKPFFACYIDGKLFRNYNYFYPQLNMTYFPPDYADTAVRNDFPDFTLWVDDISNTDRGSTSKTLIVSTKNTTEDAIRIDSIPFKYDFYEGMPWVFQISYFKSHPTNLSSSEVHSYIYGHPVEIHFQIDSVVYTAVHGYYPYNVYGKLEAILHNGRGDTINLTNGLFQLTSEAF